MKPRRRSTWLARAFPPTAWMAILAAIVARVHAAPEFRAGADRSDITPALGTPIPGGFTPPNATHVHDPLHVRSLVLDDGATRIAFVVCDVAALPLAVCDEAKRRVTQQTGLPAALRMEGNGMPLSPDLQLQVLHIVQEALSNVRKHAGATQVWLDAQQQPQWRFEIRDNGCGFDQAAGAHDETHVGLRIMAERAERIGALLEVVSAPGRGTSVILTLPPRPRAEAAVPSPRAAQAVH